MLTPEPLLDTTEPGRTSTDTATTSWLPTWQGPRKPRLLDLFCCEGGAAYGYDRAGFEVVGVDLAPRFGKRYPFEFHADDAVAFAREHGHEFDVIHASPPCQHASAGTRAGRKHGAEYPALIEPTRDALIDLGRPYVIENVRGADLNNPLTLCGTEFGLSALDEDGCPLEFWRHRGFESNMRLVGKGGCRHGWYSPQVAGVYGGARRVKRRSGDTSATLAPRDRESARNDRGGGYVPRSPRVQAELLGINWMTQYGRCQSLPPVYTEWLGIQLLALIEGEVAA